MIRLLIAALAIASGYIGAEAVIAWNATNYHDAVGLGIVSFGMAVLGGLVAYACWEVG